MRAVSRRSRSASGRSSAPARSSVSLTNNKPRRGGCAMVKVNDSTIEFALDYIDCHPRRCIFPIKAGAKSPPLIADNLAKASNDPEQIKAWHTKWPGCNWGVALKMSRVIVADVDCKPGKRGRETYDELDRQYGWPATETVETPSGGLHLYYDGEHVFAL